MSAKWRPLITAPKDQRIIIFRRGMWRWGYPRIANFSCGQWWVDNVPIKNGNFDDYVWTATPALPALNELELQVERDAKSQRDLAEKVFGGSLKPYMSRQT